MLLSDLLLLVGRRGTVTEQLPVVQFDGMTNSIEQYDTAGFDWDADVPYVATYAAEPVGTMTDASPVDVVHWEVSGNQPHDILAPWRGCLQLLERI